MGPAARRISKDATPSLVEIKTLSTEPDMATLVTEEAD